MVREFSGRAEVEAAAFGAARYGRLYAEGRWHLPLGAGWLVLARQRGARHPRPARAPGLRPRRAAAPWSARGSASLSGRQAAWLSADFRLPVRVPEIPLGSLAGTGRTATLVPFVAAGWAGGFVAAAPGGPSQGVRPVVGLGLEWPLNLLRLDVGVSPRTGRVGVAVDVSRDFWDIL